MSKKENFKGIYVIGISILSSIIISAGCTKDNDITPSGDSLNYRTSARFNSKIKYGTVVDIDSNIYKTVKIGDQVWMAENLRTTRYRNGDEIPDVKGPEWEDLTTGAFCNYNNTENLDTIATYGRLYNFYAVEDSRKLAPEGWHVATTEEWFKLAENLGGDSIAAIKLKEAGNYHWEAAYQSDNRSGFTALPGGKRWRDKGFIHMGIYGIWWTANDFYGVGGDLFYMIFYDSHLIKGQDDKYNGYSIRCVKD
ncbi:MAG TPA: fibrobacter succinogenes major paralogous domain-containing protein [Bacteroidales bacterium]|nr:fibrobacter succinogenes major paralogous domain-containing protein [Bacteroidales bacterium]